MKIKKVRKQVERPVEHIQSEPLENNEEVSSVDVLDDDQNLRLFSDTQSFIQIANRACDAANEMYVAIRSLQNGGIVGPRASSILLKENDKYIRMLQKYVEVISKRFRSLSFEGLQGDENDNPEH